MCLVAGWWQRPHLALGLSFACGCLVSHRLVRRAGHRLARRPSNAPLRAAGAQPFHRADVLKPATQPLARRSCQTLGPTCDRRWLSPCTKGNDRLCVSSCCRHSNNNAGRLAVRYVRSRSTSRPNPRVGHYTVGRSAWHGGPSWMQLALCNYSVVVVARRSESSLELASVAVCCSRCSGRRGSIWISHPMNLCDFGKHTRRSNGFQSGATSAQSPRTGVRNCFLCLCRSSALRPNPSIEATSQSPLRALCAAPHVKR